MNRRNSFDQSNSKRLNINIYYNINSKNITNNNEIQSHPVTARLIKNNIQTINEDSFLNEKKDQKNKINQKKKKKKLYSTIPCTQHKIQKNYNKYINHNNNNYNNNNNSYSNYSAVNNSKTNIKKYFDKSQLDKKIYHHSQKNQKILKQLLQSFTSGKIDKIKLTKQILNLFEFDKKNDQFLLPKKYYKKKKYDSTITCTATPKNQLSRINSLATQNIKIMQKNKKKYYKSQKPSYSNSIKQIVQKQLMDKIIQYKCINSSLFLPLQQDQNSLPKIDRTNDVQTSYSIILLNQSLKKQRQNQPQKPQIQQHLQHQMAITIQRAWRKYKTKILINALLSKSKQKPIINTDQNSIIEKMECVSEDHQQVVVESSYLSQQLINKKAIKQSQVARVQQLRDHELKKWNLIMNYVKQSIQNKQKQSGECLKQIILYFENEKKAVQNELKLQQISKYNKLFQGSRQITQFTNKTFSKQFGKQFQQFQQFNQPYLIKQIQQQSKSDKGKNIQNIQQYSHFFNHHQHISEKLHCLENQQLSQKQYKFQFTTSQQLRKLTKKSQNLSFQIVQSGLLQYQKKLNTQYYKNLHDLDPLLPTYLQKKTILQFKYKNSKKQLKRIFNNLNRGYNQAKNILQKQFLLPKKASTHQNSISKCKSDNYLLRTAINYKKYVQKKQTTQKPPSQPSHPKFQQPILLNYSQQKSQNKLQKQHKQHKQRYENQLQQSYPNPHKLSTNDRNSYPQSNFTKLDDKIFSQQLIKYQVFPNKQQFELDKYEYNSQISYKQDILQTKFLQQHKIHLLQPQKKYKNLSIDEKQDIFQFLFIDLTLQLITQYQSDNQITKKIKLFLDKQKKSVSVPKGIKTNLQSVKQYLTLLTKIINTNYKNIFENNIIVPMAPTAKQILKYMHEQDQQNQQESELDDIEHDQLSVPQVLPVYIFQQLQNKIIFNLPKYYQDDIKQQSRIRFLKSVQHIHHKALFDCLNQCLDFQRPYGIWGLPFPWKTSHKNNRNFEWQLKRKNEKLLLSIDRIIQCCSYMCGILIDKQQSIFGNYRVTQHYLEQIKQDRLSKMLVNDLIENEDRWTFFDDEQTQILIEICKLLLSNLLDEIVDDIIFIKTSRKIK